MPQGKPAAVRCIQLDENNLCRLFEKAERPAVCLSFRPTADSCGQSSEEALAMLSALESLTA
jgi:hypothetical protein